MLDEWQKKYIGGKYHYPKYLEFGDLGNSTRGITYYKRETYKNFEMARWGEIKLNFRLKSNWRIKAVLWHEFCHHWAYSVYNYSGHQGKFDDCLRTDKVLWLLGSFSRIIPML